MHVFWSHRAQTVHPLSKLTCKRHILGMSASPQKWFVSPEIVLSELCAGNKHPAQNTASRGSFFGACKTPLQKFINFSQVYAPAHWFMSAVSNMVQIIAACIQMAALYWWQKNMYNMFWHRLEETLGRFPGNFFYGSVLDNLGELIREKHFCTLPFKIIVQCQHIAVNSICLALFF